MIHRQSLLLLYPVVIEPELVPVAALHAHWPEHVTVAVHACAEARATHKIIHKTHTSRMPDTAQAFILRI